MQSLAPLVFLIVFKTMIILIVACTGRTVSRDETRHLLFKIATRWRALLVIATNITHRFASCHDSFRVSSHDFFPVYPLATFKMTIARMFIYNAWSITHQRVPRHSNDNASIYYVNKELRTKYGRAFCYTSLSGTMWLLQHVDNNLSGLLPAVSLTCAIHFLSNLHWAEF